MKKVYTKDQIEQIESITDEISEKLNQLEELIGDDEFGGIVFCVSFDKKCAQAAYGTMKGMAAGLVSLTEGNPHIVEMLKTTVEYIKDHEGEG